MLLDFINNGAAYSPEAIAAGAKNGGIVLALAGFSWLVGLVQVIAAVVAGFKHKSHGIPMICAMWFFAHDITYFMNHHHWFYESTYESTRSAWYQMGFYAAVEFTAVVQIFLYSRDEVFPGMKPWQALLSMVGLQVFAFAILWWLLSIFHDPLWMTTIVTTVIMPPMFLYPMMRGRGSRKGVNIVSVGGIVAFVPTFWLWLILSDPYFRQPVLLLLALGNTMFALACLWYYVRLPAYQPASRLR